MPQKLSDRDVESLEVMRRLRFVTAEQMAYWRGMTLNSARRYMAMLDEKGLVKVYRENRPYVYRLSDTGARYVNAEFQLRWHSAPAMHQYIMANEAEIHFRQTVDPSFEMVPPYRLRPFGLNTSVAEHPARMNGRLILTIIDDYNMRPGRVNHILTKTHKTDNNDEYQARVKRAGKAEVPRWENAVKEIIIVTTNPRREGVFSSHLTKKPIRMPYRIQVLEPVWRIA